VNVIIGGRGALRTLALTAGHKRDRFCVGAGRARNGGRRNAYGEKDCVADNLGRKGHPAATLFGRHTIHRFYRRFTSTVKGERHRPSYSFHDPFGCQTLTYVQLSRSS
jgi:hypothetical protein